MAAPNTSATPVNAFDAVTATETRDFVFGYVTCALWTSTDEDGNELDDIHAIDDITPDSRRALEATCARFIDAQAEDLHEWCTTDAVVKHAEAAECSPMECAGHDLWLTRNGNGTGFWDRGAGEVGERLSKAAEKLGEAELWLNPGGRIETDYAGLADMPLSYTIARTMPKGDVVEARIEYGVGNGSLSEGFALSGAVWESTRGLSGKGRRSRGLEPQVGGQCVRELMEAFPELAPLAALHLSDRNGVPMHAEANGLYFYRGARGHANGWRDLYGHAEREGMTERAYAKMLACKTLRVPSIPLGRFGEKGLADAFHEFVELQRPRWRTEAESVLHLIHAMHPKTEES